MQINENSDRYKEKSYELAVFLYLIIPSMLLSFFLVIIVAIAEETIFRGYLLLRFQEVRLTPSTAVLCSALIFSLGHGYEGASGVVTVGFMGAVFALVYFWRGSLVAPMVMHFLQDFIGIVLAPWLGLK
jgi:membrane protease YdiL (CAAX protease family)